MELSNEQEYFIEKALEGNNILVDACIGSGKTTAIQELCNRLPIEKRILYLTYNKLLKIDAKEKIKNKNVLVQNYHGFAFGILCKNRVKCGIPEVIQVFNRNNFDVSGYNVLILDEYQDIDTEISEMLLKIKEQNPNIQLIAVGDMAQKIYNKTSLNVLPFIEEFLDNYETLEFTRCFRLGSNQAAKLGRIWGKNIVGVNQSFEMREVSYKEAFNILKEENPEDILCLGPRLGKMAKMLNDLETKYPEKFNKKTIYASIKDSENITPTKNSGIFTTFDSSKGLERKVCVVFDYTENNWFNRMQKPFADYNILRNIFCVAASRGKEKLLFVKSDDEMLSEDILKIPVTSELAYEDMVISEMFDFKYKEDIEDCYNLLKVKCVKTEDNAIIDIQSNDGLIDLSPCIGIYEEAMFFNNYEINKDIQFQNEIHRDRQIFTYEYDTLESKILKLTASQTNQLRYKTQVKDNFIEEEQKEKLRERLSLVFSPNEQVQVANEIRFCDKSGNLYFSAKGRCDVLKKNKVYELKFVSELTHTHFLQCACYMIAMGLEKGVLWNVKKNEMYKIKIPDRQAFMDAVAKAITMGDITKFYSNIDYELER